MFDLRIVGADLHTVGSPGRIPGGAIAVQGGTIAWVGPTSGAPDAYRTIDAHGRVVTPGWIDAHTHLVFAGDRALDYRRRVEGRSYREIAEAGGGILSTVRATRVASETELIEAARPRLRRFLEHGVTTVEAKSGYGLEPESELKILRVVKRLGELQPVETVGTFLGCHAVPPEHRENPDRYVELVVREMIPAVAAERLAVFCDVFVERGFFSVEQGRRVLEAGLAAGLKPKIHADQLTAGGGAELAASVGAVSADHLDRASEEGLRRLAAAGTVAVLLPGASLFLGEPPPDAARLRDAGVRIAISTDLNPGTSPTENLPLMTTLACSSRMLSVDEALLAVTRHAAAAIARDDLGSIEPGKQADLVVWDAPSLEHIPWHVGAPHAALVVKRGAVVLERDAAPDCRP